MVLLGAFGEQAAAQVLPNDGIWCGATGQGAGLYLIVTEGGTRVQSGHVGVKGQLWAQPWEQQLTIYGAPVVNSAFATSTHFPGYCQNWSSVSGTFSSPTAASGAASWSQSGGVVCAPGTGSDTWGASWVAPFTADLALNLSAPADPLVAGSPADHPFVVRNLGPAAVSCFGLDITGTAVFQVPRLAQGAQGSLFFTELGPLWAGPTLAAGGSVGGMLQAASAPDATMLDVSAAVRTIAGTDPVLANNAASMSYPLLARADLDVTIQGPTAFTAPATLSYTAVLGQGGPSVARNARLNVVASPPLPVQEAWLEPGVGTPIPCPLPCILGDLAPSYFARLRVNFEAPSTLVPPATFDIRASLASDTTDPDTSNDSSTIMATHLTPAPPSSFYSVPPCRILDTRTPGREALCEAQDADVMGSACGIPATAVAVAVNLTVAGAGGPGHLTIYSSGFPVPAVSALNFQAGQVRANNAVIGLRPRGRITLKPTFAEGFASCVDAIVDVTGYFQ